MVFGEPHAKVAKFAKILNAYLFRLCGLGVLCVSLLNSNPVKIWPIVCGGGIGVAGIAGLGDAVGLPASIANN